MEYFLVLSGVFLLFGLGWTLIGYFENKKLQKDGRPFVCVAALRGLPEASRSNYTVLRKGFPSGRDPLRSELEFATIWRTKARNADEARALISKATDESGVGAPLVLIIASSDVDRMSAEQQTALTMLDRGEVSYESATCIGYKRGNGEARGTAIGRLQELIRVGGELSLEAQRSAPPPRKAEPVESRDGLFSDGFFGLLNKGPIGWIIFGFVAGALYAAWQTFERLLER
ncbi:MAG: hypothetical protein WAU39_08515 [Polyangiales bacterium]